MNLKRTGLIVLAGLIILSSTSIYAQEDQVLETLTLPGQEGILMGNDGDHVEIHGIDSDGNEFHYNSADGIIPPEFLSDDFLPPDFSSGPGFSPFFRSPKDTAGLVAFLKKHDPKALKHLRKFKEEKLKEEVDKELQRLWGIYSPIMMQMRTDPDRAKLMLRKIRLSRRIDEILNQSKDTVTLTKAVSELFDVIIQLEESSLKTQQELVTNLQKKKSETENPKPDKNVTSAKSLNIFRMNNMDVEARTEMLQKRKELLQSWRKQKDFFVKQRTEQLLRNATTFPWK